MLELRRVKASIFAETDDNFINLYDLEKAAKEYFEGNEIPLRKILVPAEQAIKKVLPVAQLSQKANLKQILTGKPLFKADLSKIPEEEVFALFQDETFLGVYKKVDGGDIVAKAEFVFN
jgi:hypothetical protein